MSKLAETYPEGTTVQCIVTRVEPFGVFVRLKDDEKIRGFIRPRDWSWTRRIFDLAETIEPGSEVEAKVTGVTGNRKLALNRRLALPDPFPGFIEKNRLGDTVLGQVTLVAQGNTGLVLALDGGVEGFVPRSELPHTEEEGFGVLAQDWVAGRIIGFHRKQVRLSVKELLRERQRAAADGAEESQTALRFHPSFGPSLESMRLDMELAEITQPTIDPTVREKIRKILVVEDSPNVSESLEMIFDHFEFDTDMVNSVDDATRKINENTYDLVLLDVNLPAGSGAELVRSLQHASPDGEHAETFLFVLTATRAVDWTALVSAHADHRTCFFQKPTSAKRLFEQLTRLVHGETPSDDRAYQAGLDPRGSPQVQVTPRNASLRDRVQEALTELQAATHASRAFVLSFRPGPSFELLGGHLTEAPGSEEKAQEQIPRSVEQELDISPIGDVIRQRRYLAVADVQRQERRFKHLLEVMPAGSFAGIALSYSDHSEYGLFLIGDQPNQLSLATEERLASAAQLIGHAIAEERLDQVITENQGLLLTGFLSDSLLHEIKNEVQALDDYSSVQVLLSQTKGGLNKLKDNQALELKRSVLGIQAVANRLGELILLFRNLAGRPPDRTIDVNRAIESLSQTVKPFAETKDVTIVTELDPGMPLLRVNPKLIDQPLLNIMINGVEQLGRGGSQFRRLEIESVYNEGEEYPVQILIRDNGRGIHTVQRDKIFDLFFTTKESGTGLGLYISKYFVEQLGGRLRLNKSVMFSGTEFAVELPPGAIAS